MNAVERAKEFATKKHAGQTRKGGEAYISHPEKVASFFQDEDFQIIAWLHDTIEDTDATREEIAEYFGGDIASCVYVLTHKEGQTYEEYINDIATSKHLAEIKIADICANLSDNPTKRQIKKYYHALCQLRNSHR